MSRVCFIYSLLLFLSFINYLSTIQNHHKILSNSRKILLQYRSFCESRSKGVTSTETVKHWRDPPLNTYLKATEVFKRWRWRFFFGGFDGVYVIGYDSASWDSTHIFNLYITRRDLLTIQWNKMAQIDDFRIIIRVLLPATNITECLGESHTIILVAVLDNNWVFPSVKKNLIL